MWSLSLEYRKLWRELVRLAVKDLTNGMNGLQVTCMEQGGSCEDRGPRAYTMIPASPG